MSIIRRFDKISLFETSKLVELDGHPKITYDDSVADRSFFVPMSEQIKSAQPLTGSDRDQYYDFVDGRDVGGHPPIGRKPGTDIAELSNAIREEQKRIAEGAKNALADKKRKAEFDATMNALNESASSSGNPPPASAPATT